MSEHVIHSKSLTVGGLLLWLTVLTSCSSGPKQIQVNIQGTPEMNNRRACVIYVYLLRTDTNFLNTTHLSFWQEEGETFADDIVAKRRYQLVPGDTKQESLMLTDEVNFIGAAADFNEPDKEGWRRVFPIDKKSSKEIFVVIGYNKVEIQ